MNKLIDHDDLKPGMLVKHHGYDDFIYIVIKKGREIVLKDIIEGYELYPESAKYEVVGKQRSQKVCISSFWFDCNDFEDFMEDLKDLLKTQSNARKKTYVSFPDDGSSSYLAVFTSIPVNDNEAYYLHIKANPALYDNS
jgi:hypothetical protein